MYNIEELNVRLLSELRTIATEMGMKNHSRLAKKDLIYKILDYQANKDDDSRDDDDENEDVKKSSVSSARPKRENSVKEEEKETFRKLLIKKNLVTKFLLLVF